ncbi:NAD(P)-binding domain-containing protein [Actinoalloteichus caeruleus]|uniref:NAD(P)-binding domain-containing protein n=1 Tax=Actinoalloteichus cyanogriseus TaxID=2893586 RepID=UPI003AAB39D1
MSTSQVTRVDVVVIGAGQAGLSSAHSLARAGLPPGSGFVVLDGATRPGGAWGERWPTLTMRTVHGIHQLPGMPVPAVDESEAAAVAVPRYFADYEREFDLPVRRPVMVRSVRPGPAGRLLVDSDDGGYAARALINATGTWRRPFWPRYPGQELFGGRQLHTADYRGPEEFAGQRVVVVGGGSSAVQLLLEIDEVASTVWVTRNPPDIRRGPFDQDRGREAVASVDREVRAGRPPGSVVRATGLVLPPDALAAWEAGRLARRPMFERLTPTGVAWPDGHHEDVDVVLWCTGFRPALDHLAPLRLRTRHGGIVMDGTRVVADPRVHLVGYGPSASTVGANRAGRDAVRDIRRLLAAPAADGAGDDLPRAG